MTQAAFKTFKITLFLAFSTLCSITLIFSGVTLSLLPELPSIEDIREIKLQEPLKVFTQDGKLITEYGEKHRTPISYHEIPTDFINALISAEDNRFWEHQGVDLIGLARATTQLVTTGRIQSGGSTITMQVAKNYFLSQEKTFSRKFNEILLALQLEEELKKEEILELYLNKIYLGHRAYGIAAASRAYYGKPVSQLSLAQIAMIAGLPKAPSKYNPLRNPTRAISRRDWILDRMHSLKYITLSQKSDAQAAPITAKYHAPKSEVSALYAAEMARVKAKELFPDDTYTAGYEVYTTIKSQHQKAAIKAVSTQLVNYSKRHGYTGPESNIDINEELEKAGDPSSLIKHLKDFRKIHHLEPALTWSSDNKTANFITKSGELVSIPKEKLTWARERITTNKKGSRIRKASDVVTAGDIVRIYKNEEGDWLLGQIPKAQSAFVAINPKTGGINAIQGGFEYHSSKFNRVTSARRQAGSSFKPFIYLAALEDGFTAASIINDAPVVFQDQQLETSWRPENAGGKFYGPTRLRQALYSSRNLISIRIVQTLGIRNTIASVKKYGFPEENLPKDLSISLGSAAITPLELAQAYSTLANGGSKIAPYLITSIKDSTGNIVYQNPAALIKDTLLNPSSITPSEALSENTYADQQLTPDDLQSITDDKIEEMNRIVDPRLVYIMTDMMQDVIKRGTAQKAKTLDRNDLAGKTGTTNDQVDAWFSGFNSDLVATVWVGFDKPVTLGRGEYGGRAALPIWMDFMKEALPPYESTMPQPDGIITTRINPLTGHRALPGEKDAIFEIFRSEHVPPPPEKINTQPASNTPSSQPTDVLDELFN